MIYFATFTLTALAAYALQMCDFQKKKCQAIIVSILTILIPSILGGIRSEIVGTDNLVYKAAFYKIAGMESPLQAIEKGQFEVLYNLLCYVISRFSTDYHWVCFITELITLSFIVAGLYYFKDEIPIWLGILVYLFCQYCNVMNLVRQGIALAICFFALRYLYEKKWLKYILCISVAVLFHTSAYIALLLIAVFRIVEGEKSIWRIAVLVLLSIIGVYAIPQLARILIGVGVLPIKYLAYVGDSVSISLAHTIYRLPALLVATIMYKKVSSILNIYKYLYAMLWMEIIIVQVATIFDPAYRMSLYFGYASLLIIPSFKYGIKNDKENQMLFYALAIAYLIGYWIFFTMMNGYGFKYPTYPFRTDLF